jgi:cytosine/adenosine deaminase-related metal-dependent hydrolase
VDGSGAPRRRGDVGVTGERIAAVDDLGNAEARRIIDAIGLTVAPGFIDTHTHAEGALLTDPQHAMSLRQGITTEFDADRVLDLSTYDDPCRFPVGIPYVIVNGQVAVDDERCTGVLAGQAVP